jgi:hypothetical protein
MCSPRAVLINDRETCLVNPIDVVPPQLSLVRSLYVFPNAELAKIFQHDISTLLVSIRGLNCAVATASEAVVFQIFLIAVSALPEDIAGAEINQVPQILLNLCKVFKEVECAI